MNVWPLVFSYRGVIRGNGFTARLHAISRVLAEEQEDGSIWMNGAEPGGIAIGGEDFDSAHANLKRMFHDIAWDAAEEADDLDSFRAEMDRFFRDIDQPVNAAWQAAWEANRQGQLDCEPVAALERFTGLQTAAGIDVEKLPSPAELPAGRSVNDPPRATKPEPASDRQLAIAA